MTSICPEHDNSASIFCWLAPPVLAAGYAQFLGYPPDAAIQAHDHAYDSSDQYSMIDVHTTHLHPHMAHVAPVPTAH